MGLGPPVCQHCKVIGTLSGTPIPVQRTSSTRTLNTHTSWYCRFCGETDLQEHAGFGDHSLYEANAKFLEFVHSKGLTPKSS